MARINSLQQGKQNVKWHPTEVDCYWQVIDGPLEEKLIHLSTFGSAARASVPKSSQSMQLDAAAAQNLVDLFRQVFPTVH